MRETLFAQASVGPTTHPTLAPELLALARDRLRRTSLFLGTLAAIESTLWSFLPIAVPAHSSVLSVAFVGISLGLGVLLHRGSVAPRRVLDFALAYELLVALGMASIWASFPWAYGVERIALTPVAAWVAIYPMIVPTSRPRVVLGSILAASADPIMLAVALSHRGDPWPDPGELFGQLYGNGAAVLIAIVGSNTIYRLGRELKAARELGAYRLEERLGGGGMGEVWRASHRFLARPAAVKLIAPPAETEGEDEQLLLRFEREAQATALLQSPHTVELYDFGRAQDGRFYYVMELLEGMDLQKLVAEHGPQPPARVAFLLRQILHSLTEAHADGFVHRDVKPANVFVCRYGLDLDFVKVLDFGLVRSTPDAEDAPAALARSLAEGDVLRGTPAFMAPEQILGDPLDGRADLYAVGGVAYWLLTGELVFEGETPMAIVMQHLKEEPEPPSVRAGRSIPEPLEDLVMALLAKTPEQRPASAARACELLEGLADGWTPEARRAWWEAISP